MTTMTPTHDRDLDDAERRRKLTMRKRADYFRARGMSTREPVADETLRERAQAHVAGLRRTVGASHRAIADAAGVSVGTVFNIDNGAPAQEISCRKVLAVAPNALESTSSMHMDEATWMVRTLQAVGYSITWQEETAGITRGVLRVAVGRGSRGEQATLKPVVASKLRALHRKYAYTAATAESTGQKKGTVTRARSLAREWGYYPAAAYDPGSILDPRSVPGHPWAIADDHCLTHIERLRIVLDNPGVGEAVLIRIEAGGERIERGERAYGRMLDRLRIRSGRPGTDERRQILKDALWELDVQGGDPVVFALTHNLVMASPSGVVRPDHPAVKAWEESTTPAPAAGTAA